ncbi:MAG TPA: acetyltransferase [Candidatus Acidoferrales bacterium]|nr:acetyltransferase [Candidatus Acidoferrales bacterium]
MKSRRIFVYGAGGHGKVVADILISKKEKRFAGFLDDREELVGTKVMGYSVLGNGEWLNQKITQCPAAVVLGIGNNHNRRQLSEQLAKWGIQILTAIHPGAIVATSAELGAGTVVMAGAVVNANAKIGEGVIVNTGAVVEHDVDVGDYSHISPNASLGGAARIRELSHVGLGAVVLPGVTIDSESVIGAGAVVLQDLPAKIVAVGVPARILRRL